MERLSQIKVIVKDIIKLNISHSEVLDVWIMTFVYINCSTYVKKLVSLGFKNGCFFYQRLTQCYFSATIDSKFIKILFKIVWIVIKMFDGYLFQNNEKYW